MHIYNDFFQRKYFKCEKNCVFPLINIVMLYSCCKFEQIVLVLNEKFVAVCYEKLSRNMYTWTRAYEQCFKKPEHKTQAKYQH